MSVATQCVSTAVLALTIAGCAVTQEEAASPFEQATPCCTALSELRYQPLAPDRTELFDIDANSQLFVFETGRSFLLAVELPALAPPYTVQVRSYALGDTVQRSRVFYPAALLLDANHRVMARREAEDLSVVKGSYSEASTENRWGLPLRLEWEILIDEPATRYLVIHTTEHRLASGSLASTRQVVPIILPGFVTALPGKKQEVIIAHSPFGRLALRVLP